MLVAALMLVCSMIASAAPATWNTSYNNYSVVLGGRTELLGNVTLTAALGVTTDVASSIQLDYGLPIVNATDNFAVVGNVWSNAHGVTITVIPFGASTLTGAAITSVKPVGSTAIRITIATATAITQYDRISINGLRADVASLASGSTVTATISSVPAEANSYFPSTVQVATVASNFVVKNITSALGSVCKTGSLSAAGFDIQEGFSGAFATYTTAGANAAGGVKVVRTAYGGTANTNFTIQVSNLPKGVKINWPTYVLAASTANLTKTDDGKDNTMAVYTFYGVAGSDTTQETFTFAPTGVAATDFSFTIDGTKAEIGQATFTVAMGPEYDPDTDYFDEIVSYTIPASDAKNLMALSGCVTNLMFPYVVKGFGGYDTGIAVANTSYDASAIPDGQGADPKGGTVSFFFYPKFAAGQTVAATPASFTTGTVAAGDSYANVVSALLPAGAGDFQGYVLAVCNFKFAHGYAYVAFNMGQASGIAQGYIANVMNDFSGAFNSRQSYVNNAGSESLGQ